jgi:hypothetical protein
MAGKAQPGSKHACYFNSELHAGNFLGFDLGLNYVFQQSYAIRAGYTQTYQRASTLPKDYTPGVLGVLLLGVASPFQSAVHYQLAVGKLLPLNQSGTVRFNLMAGVGYTDAKEPAGWQPIGANFWEPNYSWEYRSFRAYTILVNPKLELPLLRYFGITLSPLLMLNRYNTYFGLGVGQTVGMLRPPKPQNSY